MAKYSGIKGNVTIASGTGNWGGDGSATGIKTTNVSKWSGTFDAEPKDVTTYASAGWRESLNGNKQFTGTLDMFDDSAIVFAIGTGTNPTVTLTSFDGSGTDKTFAFSAVLESVATGTDGNTGDPVVVTYNFRSTGAVTIT